MNIYTPYTYYLYHPPTKMKYYGASYANSKSKIAHPSQLWTTYFTSSPGVKRLIEQYGKDSFLVEIRKTFSDGNSTRSWEQRVIRKLEVWKRKDWINKTKQTPSHEGFKHSAETKQLISRNRKGKYKVTSSHKAKMVDGISQTMKITFPDGRIEVVKGIKPFCVRHNLDSSHLTKVAKGKIRQHKGYVAEYV